ncbi:hypothetical protein [Streptomyces phytophilus]|uniref:hypothetical protein n=1 Tax=Streptomyces phytophilus TaxID=722715 RepID=UPI0015F0A1AA|nr:hypothetical protein [Streptomyces phytophilus]
MSNVDQLRAKRRPRAHPRVHIRRPTRPRKATALPPLREDLLYDAEAAGRYVGRTAQWMKRAARAGRIPAVRDGRFWKWNAPQIRQIVAGDCSPPDRRPKR